MKYTCPECQKIFKEIASLEDFTATCPHCGAAVSIPADLIMVEGARKEAEEKQEAARKEAEQKASEVAKQDALRLFEEQNARAVALVRRSVKRICPHCRKEVTLEVDAKAGDDSFVVRCDGFGCGKKFTIQSPSDDLTSPLADILSELVVIRYRMGVLLVCLFVIPAIIGIIFAIIHAN
jgi:DNA-directed RNA polymerase subunit M/transcription elongation factor TFIIS